MSGRLRSRAVLGAAAAAVTLALAGCTNPDAPSPEPLSKGGSGVQSPGEPKAPPPRQGPAPADVQSTPQQALEQYARLYANWTYKTLVYRQRELAAISTGAARLTDLQAAKQTSTDTTLAGSKVENSGEVIAVAANRASPGEWVVVTRERTSGGGEYAALPARYHVTLARLASCAGGWAVRQWLPQT